MPSELIAAFAAALLLVAHVSVQAASTWLARGGIRWGLGARDAELDRGVLGGRADRALRNYLETLPLFILALICVRETGASGPLIGSGASLYIAGRALFLPLYLLGVPVLRSVVWGAATLGPILMLAGAWTGIE